MSEEECLVVGYFLFVAVSSLPDIVGKLSLRVLG